MHRSAKVVRLVAILLGSCFLPDFSFRVKQTLGVVRNDSPSSFSRTLNFLQTVVARSRRPIIMAACDSSAFTCEEIIQLASVGSTYSTGAPGRWAVAVALFAEGRNNKGCISDPANAQSIVVAFERKWPASDAGWLKQLFIDNVGLKPAKDVGPSPMRLQTVGLRTAEDMEKLLADMAQLKLHKTLMYSANLTVHEGLSADMAQLQLQNALTPVDEFKGWLKQIRAQGQQFSGSQLVDIVRTFCPGNRYARAQAMSVFLQYLEQYVTGVTCEEVRQISEELYDTFGSKHMCAGLTSLKSSIVDGQNKAVLYLSCIYRTFVDVEEFEKVFRDVGLGLPPKNNPIFGVVKGNPVIFVVDSSTSMDQSFTLGNDTLTRRTYCHSQLEEVLEALPNGTKFNVVQYSSSAVRIFPKTVLASRTNIDAAMRAVTGTWRGSYTPGQDPAEMLENIKVFALKFKHHHLPRSAKRNVMEALQLAYATAELPSQQTGEGQDTARDDGALEMANDSPQIYFMNFGKPDGDACQMLDKIDDFDPSRNIPVNSISFSDFACPETQQYVRYLATRTGGFFRHVLPVRAAS